MAARTPDGRTVARDPASLSAVLTAMGRAEWRTDGRRSAEWQTDGVGGHRWSALGRGRRAGDVEWRSATRRQRLGGDAEWPVAPWRQWTGGVRRVDLAQGTGSRADGGRRRCGAAETAGWAECPADLRRSADRDRRTGGLGLLDLLVVVEYWSTGVGLLECAAVRCSGW
ncbi:hypothetical protein GUJ93_ZPchr0009g1687 [Zizania palustris]|uniref:Uncharacterized protein n=1 Tax=Zizania palustris TaxID=103762 RepID=A0A8J5UZD6_ZIZPA|nr:hypothetical protein GUJ93_ZPchr0009g1687 [Zizania palustris]